MKTLSIITFLLFPVISFAQLKRSFDATVKYMAKENDFEFYKKGRSNDGLAYISYKCNNERAITQTFYFKSDTCNLVKFIISNDQLSKTVKELNEKFTSVGHNQWITKTKSAVYSITFFDNEPIFEVDMEPYEIYDPIGILN